MDCAAPPRQEGGGFFISGHDEPNPLPPVFTRAENFQNEGVSVGGDVFRYNLRATKYLLKKHTCKKRVKTWQL